MKGFRYNPLVTLLFLDSIYTIFPASGFSNSSFIGKGYKLIHLNTFKLRLPITAFINGIPPLAETKVLASLKLTRLLFIKSASASSIAPSSVN